MQKAGFLTSRLKSEISSLKQFSVVVKPFVLDLVRNPKDEFCHGLMMWLKIEEIPLFLFLLTIIALTISLLLFLRALTALTLDTLAWDITSSMSLASTPVSSTCGIEI